MPDKISPRLSKIVEALPIREGMRILEIGCGPGVAAREIVKRYGDIYVLAIDRSEKTIKQAINGSRDAIKSGKLEYRAVSIEDFELEKNDRLFDLAFAIRLARSMDGILK